MRWVASYCSRIEQMGRLEWMEFMHKAGQYLLELNTSLLKAQKRLNLGAHPYIQIFYLIFHHLQVDFFFFQSFLSFYLE